MARRKVFHSNKISYVDGRYVSLETPVIGDIIEFKYTGLNVFDSKPLVFILVRGGDFIRGINLNYLTEYRVQQLLQEVNLKKMKWYELYDQFIRTYKKNKINSIKRVKYERNMNAT